MKSDTVVGVVGALLLVAVMVGVFVYEANNVEAENGPEPSGELAAFNTRYGALDVGAYDDLDGDGVSNLNDTDLDQDGTDNVNDTTVAYEVDFTGSFPASPQTQEREHTFPVTRGAVAWEIVLTYDVVAPQLLPQQPMTPNIALSVATANGAKSCTTAYDGMTATCTIELPRAELEFRMMTATLTETVPGPETDYTLSVHVVYGDVPAQVPPAA